ncbi:U1 small nuclear ribonucleoprotein 70 kDa-like isoform X2 [Zingiber officinale]|uniref:U1 small nuclear ribonucleoprotein 70 kDa-like isoform X2 n=1 Tax=Zingiber officinale TaxID=94328 RepID=UPI001C4B0FD5|nr:U1 small nuclear ribonucleoprotein 70 kDa-like isoform X2 [Zingiber officinale]
MTIDDEKSIYVGGLPYECTQEDLHRAFDLYGAIMDVKIVNDRHVGGKCYGFVTFRNPRSAVDAITDMNGRKIGGRVVRVNEVHTRGGRPNFHRENFHRDEEDYWDRDRERVREKERERDHLRDRDHYLDRNSERSQDNNREREPDFEHDRDFIQAREHPVEQVLDLEDEDHDRQGDHDKDWERDHDMDWSHDRELDKPKDRDGSKSMDKEQQSRQQHGTGTADHQSRDISSNSSDDYRSQVRKEMKEQLELSIHRREELENEITIIGDKIEAKKLLISDLQKKSQELEDSLANAKKVTSQQQSMLMKLHSCYLQSQDLADRLKSSEQELQSLVDAATSEVDVGKDANARDGSVYAIEKV